MFKSMIAHYANQSKAERAKKFDALDSRYVDSLTKLYAKVYGR